MTMDVEALLSLVRSLAPDELPRFLGDLEMVRAIAWSRLSTPENTTPATSDELIDIEQAASLLGVSCSYLYHNHNKFPFSRRVGRTLRFSSHEIQRYIERTSILTPRRRGAILTPATQKQEIKTQ
jgi:predicted DNA-binding transcriptional regulator AlpA